MYLNYTLVFLVDLPSQLFCLLYLDKFGRKVLFGGSQLLAGVTFLAAGAVIMWEQQGAEVRNEHILPYWLCTVEYRLFSPLLASLVLHPPWR